MRIKISNSMDYYGEDQSKETYDLEVEGEGELSSRIAEVYLELREKLNKAIKEAK